MHIDLVAYTAMVAEMNALCKEKRLRIEAQVPPAHAPLPLGNVRPNMPSDNGLMFGGCPDL